MCDGWIGLRGRKKVPGRIREKGKRHLNAKVAARQRRALKNRTVAAKITNGKCRDGTPRCKLTTACANEKVDRE